MVDFIALGGYSLLSRTLDFVGYERILSFVAVYAQVCSLIQLFLCLLRADKSLAWTPGTSIFCVQAVRFFYSELSGGWKKKNNQKRKKQKFSFEKSLFYYKAKTNLI